jgi:hypothetical protein
MGELDVKRVFLGLDGAGDGAGDGGGLVEETSRPA